MSLDIFFWKQTKRLKSSPESIYVRLNNDKKVRGVEEIPVDRIVDRLQALLPGFTPEATEQAYPPGYGGATADDVEVVWGPQYFRFDGSFPQTLQDQLVDLMIEFGCAMYAPAIDRHYVKVDGYTPVKPQPPKLDIKTKVVRMVQRSAREQGLVVEPLPVTIELRPAEPDEFHWSPIAQNIRAQFTHEVSSAGYVSIGAYAAPGVGVLIEAFYGPPNLFVCNYEHRIGEAYTGAWDEIIAVGADDTLRIWSGDAMDGRVPPWVTREPSLGPFHDRDRAIRVELAGEEAPTIAASDFVGLVERFYAREMAWRAAL
ncbi:MAG: hypothetical protein AAF743_00045 [Planctomycetota bacterium]